MSEDEFWILTPAEFDRKVWAFNKRQKDLGDMMVSSAWLTAKFTKARHIPSLKIVLHPESRVVTGEEKARLQAEHERMIAEMEK